MSRCTCDIPNCDGIECYLDYPAEPEIDPREIAEQVARAKAFWERLAVERFVDCGPDPLRHIEPRARRVA